jgi:CMP-N-acetylneuraminic acid synthetase
VAGRSLMSRAVTASADADLVDAVYLTTDDPAIADAAPVAGAEIIWRPQQLACDQASSESALLHALDHLFRAGSSPRSWFLSSAPALSSTPRI